MRTRFVWALLLGLTACERRASQVPDEDPPPRKGYGDMMWSESTSIQPLEVCQHLGKVVAAESGKPDTAIDPELVAACEADMRIEAGIRGTDGWNTMASCVMNSRSAADIDYCDRTYPLPDSGPTPTGPSIIAITERELEVCEHMIQVLMLESAAASGEVPPISVEERRHLVQDCAESLVVDQKPTLTPKGYEKLLECIESAESSDQMGNCEG